MKNLLIIIYFFILSCSNKGCKKIYDKDGLLITEGCYSNGVQRGLTKEYYKSGKIKTLAKFYKGKISDTIKGFYENGKLEFIQFKSSNGLDSVYYYRESNSALLSKGTTKNSRVSGWMNFYNKEGNKIISSKELLYVDKEDEPYINQTFYY